jgi:predicted dehydrogenase
MTVTEPLRFALIGAGSIAQTHFQAFANTSKGRLTAIVDVREETARSTAEALHCAAFTSVEALLESNSVEAAIVCTPPSTHETICHQLARGGIHILCEKPFAITSKAARAMVDVAQQHAVVLTMASKFRYVNDMVYAKQLLSSGVLGEVLLFENTFAGKVDMSRRWNSDPAWSGGGVLIDNGTHSVDIVRYLFGPVQAIQTTEGVRVQGLAVEDTVRVHLKTQSGALGAIDLSWSINKQTPWYCSIYGTEGTVLVGWSESKYKRASDQDWIVFGTGYNKVQAFTDQLVNFCDAVLGAANLIITAEDALASVSVIESSYESLRRDDWIAIRPSTPSSVTVPS